MPARKRKPFVVVLGRPMRRRAVRRDRVRSGLIVILDHAPCSRSPRACATRVVGLLIGVSITSPLMNLLARIRPFGFKVAVIAPANHRARYPMHVSQRARCWFAALGLIHGCKHGWVQLLRCWWELPTRMTSFASSYGTSCGVVRRLEIEEQIVAFGRCSDMAIPLRGNDWHRQNSGMSSQTASTSQCYTPIWKLAVVQRHATPLGAQRQGSSACTRLGVSMFGLRLVSRVAPLRMQSLCSKDALRMHQPKACGTPRVS